jgi:hypothetical protein
MEIFMDEAVCQWEVTGAHFALTKGASSVLATRAVLAEERVMLAQ